MEDKTPPSYEDALAALSKWEDRDCRSFAVMYKYRLRANLQSEFLQSRVMSILAYSNYPEFKAVVAAAMKAIERTDTEFLSRKREG